MDTLLSDLMQKATTHGSKIHVMGAANVGKSSFINRLLDTSKAMNHAGLINNNRKGKRGSKASSRNVAQATVSNLPGKLLCCVLLCCILCDVAFSTCHLFLFLP